MALTLTSLATNGAGNATVWADGTTRPNTTSINFTDGTIRTNTITVPLGLVTGACFPPNEKSLGSLS